jgi:hypothetical protein
MEFEVEKNGTAKQPCKQKIPIEIREIGVETHDAEKQLWN